MSNYNLVRLIRRCIRQMKAEYGHPITLYQLGNAETDYETGVKSRTHTSVYIKRAVVLPSVLTREIYQSISVISANKRVVQGGSFDPAVRRFIIDRTDVPSTYTVKNDDWIVYAGARYDIKKVEEYEYETAWLVYAHRIEGAPVHEDLYIKQSDLTDGYMMTLTQNVTGVIA